MPSKVVHAALTTELIHRHDLLPLAAPARAHRSPSRLVDPAHAPIDFNHRFSGRPTAALGNVDAGRFLAVLTQKQDPQSGSFGLIKS